MATIPLPALHTAPIQPGPSPLAMYGQMMGIQNAGLEQQQRQQALQTGQLEQQGAALNLQRQQQMMKDQQAFGTAMRAPENHGKTLGDLADSLASTGSISPAFWMQMKQADLGQRTALATYDEKGLANLKAAYEPTLQLYTYAKTLSPEQLAAQWPSLAQQYDAIPGNEKVPLDPQRPMTIEQLDQFGPMLAMHGAYLDQAIKRRKDQADASAAEATGRQKNLSLYAQQLAGAPNQDAYGQLRASLPPEYATMFPAQYDRAAILSAGMTPDQLAAPHTVSTAEGVYDLLPGGAKGTRIGSPTKALQMNMGASPGNSIADAAQEIYEGKAPPVLSEYSYRDRTNIVSQLRRIDPNFNLAGAEQDWKATQKYLATLNGAQQTRLRQALGFTADTLPQIKDAYEAWKQTGLPSGFQSFNSAALKAAENLPGKAGSTAHQLDALLADFTSELGTVYKGGNSSTDESLKLAAQNLSSNWNDQTFNDALTRIARSLQIRRNSMGLSAEGVSAGSPYTIPATEGGRAPAPSGPAGAGAGGTPTGAGFFNQFGGVKH